MNRPAAGGAGDGGAGARGVLIILGSLLVGAIVAATFSPGTTQVAAGGPTGGDQPRQRVTTTTAAVSTTTTLPLRDPKTVRVLPANGTSVGGAASKVGDALKAHCWSVQRAVDATSKVKAERRPTTTVYPRPGFEREAATLATQLGLREANTASLPPESPIPTRGAPEFDILVVVGQDLADVPPEAIREAPCAPAGSTTTARGTATANRRTTSSTARTTTTRAATTTSARPTTTAP